MSKETQTQDRKSLRVLKTGDAGWTELAKDCVCFANADGGTLLIGIEDGENEPLPDQKIEPELLDRLRKRLGELTVNVQVAPVIMRTENGGEHVALRISRSTGIASTVDGRYYIRVGDTCNPVVGDEVMRLLTDRPQAPWEMMRAAGRSELEKASTSALMQQLRASERVKESVKIKTDSELLAHYGLTDDGQPTHLGVLILGRPNDRARLGTAPIVQAIKYDEHDQKVAKWTWDDYTLSPLELPDAIWETIPDFRESYEVADGLFRRNIPAYDKRVVRELLVNALVHRPYTQRGDIFLNLHPDRLEVVNPGRLPIGVTPANILHERRRRNQRMVTLFHDVKLMEGEGSGYDLMYEVQLSWGRAVPVPKEGCDWFSATVTRRVLRPRVIAFMEDAEARFQLRQRERIALGLLATSDGMTARELAQWLELEDVADVRSVWLGRLLDFGLVEASGRTQGTRYFVQPAALKDAGLDHRTTLSQIEPHRLRALIREDLRRYPGSSSPEIRKRTAPELSLRSIRRALEELHDRGEVVYEGEKRWRHYWPASNGQKL